MPKYRQLHTKIIDSFDFNEMPDDFTRVVWMLLTLILDSEGRGIDNAGWIRSKMFPMRTDVTDEQIESAFNWLKKRKMIVRYSIKGRNFFYVPTFKLYQTRTEREAPSNIPAQIQEITPELVRSKSEVSQEKGRLAESASASASVYESESVNTPIGVFVSQFQDHSPVEAERLYRDITGQFSIPADHRDNTINTLVEITCGYTDHQKMVEDGKRVFKNWCNTKSKTTGKFYSRTNPAWLGKWLEELAPAPPRSKEDLDNLHGQEYLDALMELSNDHTNTT
jgi:hypothetical protein